MAFNEILANEIDVGDAIKKELWDKVKDNFTDLNSRLDDVEGAGARVSLFNTAVRLGSYDNSFLLGDIDVEVIQDCVISEGAIQIYEKSPATTGNLVVDIKKNTTTNPSGFNSVFTSPPAINVAVASDYTRATGTLNPTYQTLTKGDILRVEITSIPTGLQKFRLVLFGEI